MAKNHRKGVQIGDVVVLQGDPTQMRKIRCPGCTTLCVVKKDKTGKEVCVCSKCNRVFVSKRL